MAERLTRNNKFSIYNQNNLETMYDKLAEIEDTMEEYGIESVEKLSNALEYAKVIGEILCEYGINDNENLEWFLDDYSKNQGRDFAICEERDTLRQDRDTWKRACELACKRICYMLDQEMQYHKHEKFNSKEYLKTEIDYFYQQAKKAKKENDEQSN